jgi:plastocyanin
MDSVMHTATSDSGSELASTSLSKGESYTHTFTTPGTYNYHCAVHPSMKGKIIVE